MSLSAFIDVFNKRFESYVEEARRKARQIYDDEFIKEKDPLAFEGAVGDFDLEFDEGVLTISCELNYDDQEIMAVAFDIPIDIDTAIEIIGYYINKFKNLENIVNKLKEKDHNG